MLVLLLLLGAAAVPVGAMGAQTPHTVAAAPASAEALAPTGTLASLADTVLTLPEVRVTRERGGTAAARRAPTAFTTEIRAGAEGRALETVTDLLAEGAGVTVTRYGGLGAFSTVSLRGAPPGQVSVYLDGAPITSAGSSVVNLSDLPITALERVEVYRGAAPLALGVATPGGAVNLVTAAGTEELTGRVVRGSFDTWEGHGSTAGRRGALAGVLHVAYQGSAGDFRYLDGNGTPLNAADDSVVTRRNDRLDAATAIGTLLWTPRSGVLLRARQNWFQRAQGVPGLGAVPALHPRLVFRRSISQLEAEREAGGAWPALRLRGSLQREWERLRDTGAELGLGRHDTDDRLDGEDLGLQAEWSRLPLGLALQAVGALREERARLADAADGYPDPPGSGRESRGSALTLQWRTWRERLLISAGRRWDRQSDRLRSVGVGGALVQGDAERVLNTPQLGARLAAPLGFELRANWTRAQRAPEFLELFGDQGSVLGNPALRPERGENWDAGAAWSGTGPGGVTARLEYAHFASHARDYIVYVKNSQSSVRAQNVSRAEIAGDELALRLATPFGLSATATATWEKAVDHGPVPFWRGRDLPQRPRRQAHARLHWGRGRLGLDSQLELLGENFLDPANRQRVPARALAGASVSLALLGDALRLVVEGKNLGDERASDVGGFPLPGRSVFVSCESRLGGARARRS